MAQKRIEKELNDFNKDPPPNITLKPINNNDIFNLKATIFGPSDSPYEGGTYHLKIVFSKDYPFRAPRYTFTTKIYHPQISVNGHIDLDIFKDHWSPALTIEKCLLSIQSFLMDPNPEDPLLPEIAHVYKSNIYIYYKTAHEWAVKYAGAPVKNTFLDNLKIKIINNIENENMSIRQSIEKEIDYELNYEKVKNLNLIEEINNLKKKLENKKFY